MSRHGSFSSKSVYAITDPQPDSFEESRPNRKAPSNVVQFVAGIVLERRSPVGKEAIKGLIEEVRLFTFKGIGHHHGRLLTRAGIHTLADLEGQDPNALYARLVEVRKAQTFPALRPGMVRVWVLAARP